MRITQGWWMVADDVDSADLGSYSKPVIFKNENVGASSGKTKNKGETKHAQNVYNVQSRQIPRKLYGHGTFF
jgi:hypothetical protein